MNRQEEPMDDRKNTEEIFGQLTGKMVETMTVWADANQRVLRELVELSTATAKEGVRLCGELRQGAWSDGAKDPVQLYQKALLSGVDGVEKAVKLMEGQAQAITRSAERIQTSAEQAGKGIQETYAAVVEKMKGVYQN